MEEHIGPQIIDRSGISDWERTHERIVSEEGAIMLVDKPYGETSFFVVNRIRRAITESTGIKWVKVGHAGTLDPLATGLLLIATRRQTKSLHLLTGADKTYLVTLRFGITSPSFDLERPVEIVGNESQLKESDIIGVLQSFVGEISQVPPIYSAVKQEGRPVYHRARKGEEPTMEARTVSIRSIEIVKIALPSITFRVACSKGTYIRSLVRDIGEALGTAAILTDLVRESVGEWKLQDALQLPEAVALARPVQSSVSEVAA